MIHILKEIYYIVLYDQIGNKNMCTPEQDTFPTHSEIQTALEKYGGYSAKIDKRYKLV